MLKKERKFHWKNKMKLHELNKSSIRKISNKELLHLHSRIHQLWAGAKKRKVNSDFKNYLKDIHKLLIDEMIRRKMKHKSLLESYLFLLNFS